MWLMSVVSRRRVENLWVWLECIGVVRRYNYRYPHNNYFSLYTPLVLALFIGSSIPISLFILKMFFRSYVYKIARFMIMDCIDCGKWYHTST